MKKPIYEAEFDLGGETKNFYFFTLKKPSNVITADFHPSKIYLGKDYCKELKSKIVKLSITEKETEQ